MSLSFGAWCRTVGFLPPPFEPPLIAMMALDASSTASPLPSSSSSIPLSFSAPTSFPSLLAAPASPSPISRPSGAVGEEAESLEDQARLRRSLPIGEGPPRFSSVAHIPWDVHDATPSAREHLWLAACRRKAQPTPPPVSRRPQPEPEVGTALLSRRTVGGAADAPAAMECTPDSNRH
eukprot:CAMPEP_0206293900 /NCGR_PEP_ID=MMETSP0106_2-20121207/4373_1 /ASSEMBLY_ACC=CAM_ASM_000206 /TAXON_ID=81532 /ORGANISM="Acanthoeca-like sp., Strain 10tr" /LENGTH=177 /DNA_ID=CAMNT_0053724505 /DNA_START=466 /DNA_END=1001 /DNA_ORIENTATION=+